jgi:hypothetical protein
MKTCLFFSVSREMGERKGEKGRGEKVEGEAREEGWVEMERLWGGWRVEMREIVLGREAEGRQGAKL